MNPIKDQNYIALDLELNNHNDDSIPRIIEVGVAIGSPLKEEEIITCNWYLNPGEPIEPFITQLTGITDETISESAVSHETVATELGKLIQLYHCFVNPITWGQDDVDELKAEFSERNIRFPFFGRRIIDVKTITSFNQIVSGRSVGGGLRKTMNSYGLRFDGTPHRASDDAKNTLRFFFHLLNRNRQLNELIDSIKAFK